MVSGKEVKEVKYTRGHLKVKSFNIPLEYDNIFLDLRAQIRAKGNPKWTISDGIRPMWYAILKFFKEKYEVDGIEIPEIPYAPKYKLQEVNNDEN